VAGEPLCDKQQHHVEITSGPVLALHILDSRIPFTRMWTNWTTTSEDAVLGRFEPVSFSQAHGVGPWNGLNDLQETSSKGH
jgi:hypothetical protein